MAKAKIKAKAKKAERTPASTHKTVSKSKSVSKTTLTAKITLQAKDKEPAASVKPNSAISPLRAQPSKATLHPTSPSIGHSLKLMRESGSTASKGSQWHLGIVSLILVAAVILGGSLFFIANENSFDAVAIPDSGYTPTTVQYFPDAGAGDFQVQTTESPKSADAMRQVRASEERPLNKGTVKKRLTRSVGKAKLRPSNKTPHSRLTVLNKDKRVLKGQKAVRHQKMVATAN